MINLTERISINPSLVSEVAIDTRHYMNGSETSLRVRMADGTIYRVEHGWGTDVFALKQQIEDAAQGDKT